MADIKIPNETAAQLRPLAAALNLKMSRGIGAKQIGSIPALFVILGSVYTTEPEYVEKCIRQALRMNEEWCVCNLPKDECCCEAPQTAQDAV